MFDKKTVTAIILVAGNSTRFGKNRNNTWLIQTPQCFDKSTILKMHQKHKYEDVTDDCALLEKEGYKIKIIPGEYSNIKITTSEDLDIVRELLIKI